MSSKLNTRRARTRLRRMIATAQQTPQRPGKPQTWVRRDWGEYWRAASIEGRDL